ncbi:MAG: CoB--CoM heterodisulfide reductase iron-sulfur subunit A family protein [Nitrospirota bacterium]
MAEQSVLVIGGGISGLTAALESAEAGYDVHLVERNPYLGGRVAQLYKYFPKLCPPVCGLELNFRRLKENPRINVYTMAEVSGISGTEGDFDVTVTLKPRYVNERCVGCDACAEACPVHKPNDFNFGLDKSKAAYLPFAQAFPFRYVIDKEHCTGDCAQACKDACKYDAVDLDMKPESMNLKVGSVVVATGWNPYEAERMDNLQYGKVNNLITNMQMERLAAANGPTGGKILRPSDGKEPKRVAFVQCAGSRDENHLNFCSYICCMASLKQITYLRDQYEEFAAEVFYIDIRTPGRYEQFYWNIKEDPRVAFTKGKVAKIKQAAGDAVEVTVEDALTGKKSAKTFDLVVLATGMQPSGARATVPGVTYVEEGFAALDAQRPGVVPVGTARTPLDVQRSVQDATGAAVKSIHTLVRR